MSVTQAQQQQFITAMSPQALAAAQMITGSNDPAQLKTAQTAILSQWAQETGWGTSNAATQNNNFAGIKCWSGCTCGGTYCMYASPTDFAVAYSKFMTVQDTEGLYAGVVSALKSGSLSQIYAALSSSPWDIGHYTSADWTSLTNTVQGLLGVAPSSSTPASPTGGGTQSQCSPPSGLTDITGGLAYIQCSLVSDLKWAGTNILIFAILIMLLYLLVRDTSAGQYVINQGKQAVKDAAVAAAA